MRENFFALEGEKRDRILAAALEVFGASGYRGGTTEEIAAKARISKGLLFHYFENKWGIFSFAYEYARRLLALSWQEAGGGMALAAYVEAQREASAMYPALPLFLLRASRDKEERVQSLRQALGGHARLDSAFSLGMDIDGGLAAGAWLAYGGLVLDGLLFYSLEQGHGGLQSYFSSARGFLDSMQSEHRCPGDFAP